MKRTLCICILALATAVAGCSKKEPTPQVSFDTLEQARGTANENALFNAQRYRVNNVILAGYGIIANGDSTQTNECPQGDGWATVKFVSPDKTQVVPVKCSTVSGNVGCMLDSDYKTKSYAADDGHCQPITKVPFPIKKIQG
jgi:hypothetical protein